MTGMNSATPFSSDAYQPRVRNPHTDADKTPCQAHEIGGMFETCRDSSAGPSSVPGKGGNPPTGNPAAQRFDDLVGANHGANLLKG